PRGLLPGVKCNLHHTLLCHPWVTNDRLCTARGRAALPLTESVQTEEAILIKSQFPEARLHKPESFYTTSPVSVFHSADNTPVVALVFVIQIVFLIAAVFALFRRT